MYNKRRFVLCALLISLVATLASAQVYKITDLGSLSPTAINIWGQVVGNLNGQAFIWTRSAGRKGLGILTGGTFSNAASINDLGVVAGTADGQGTVISPDPSVDPNQQCSDLTQPFIWTPRTGMQGLGTVGTPLLFGFYRNCNYPFFGRGINDFAQVVGDMPVSDDELALGFFWTSANGMSLFGGSWPPSFALAISNTGEMVGQNSDNVLLGIGHATTWKGSVTTDLGSLGGGPDVVDYGSSANGVNDLGVVVGWSTTSAISCCSGSSPVHAVLWTPSGAINDLGTLPGDTSSAAVKTNFFGQVIGFSGSTLYYWNDGANAPFEVIGRPFIWTQRNGMQDLNTLISANSGWVLNSATDINIWGQIVGSGSLNGQNHGFLLTPKF